MSINQLTKSNQQHKTVAETIGNASLQCQLKQTHKRQKRQHGKLLFYRKKYFPVAFLQQINPLRDA